MAGIVYQINKSHCCAMLSVCVRERNLSSVEEMFRRLNKWLNRKPGWMRVKTIIVNHFSLRIVRIFINMIRWSSMLNNPAPVSAVIKCIRKINVTDRKWLPNKYSKSSQLWCVFRTHDVRKWLQWKLSSLSVMVGSWWKRKFSLANIDEVFWIDNVQFYAHSDVFPTTRFGDMKTQRVWAELFWVERHIKRSQQVS